jgi:mono/diheme cytochrome c family protein
MRAAGIVIVGGLLLAAPAFARDAAQIDKGKALFTAQKCGLCHSIGGKGNPKGALDSVGAKLKPPEIRQWLVSPTGMAEKAKATRKPPMKPFDRLSKDELDALVAYLETLKK